MLRQLVLICFLAGLSASHHLPRCPKGINGFAGPSDTQYYDCRKGRGVAELVTCQDGMRYDTETAGCSVLLAKRDDEAKSETKVALGEAIRIGTLYDVRNSRMYSGYGLYSKQTLTDFTTIIPGTLGNIQDIYVEATSREARAKFGLGAELELEFMSGLIKVTGSAEYVKDDVKKSNTARVVMKKEIQGDVHELNIHGANIDYDFCNLVSENAGPTHVISRVVYGQRSYMVFEKDASLEEDKEHLKGSLHAKIDMIPDLTIDAQVAIHINGTEYANDDKMTVKFYGDAILDRVPRSWLDAINTFNTVLDIIENGQRKLSYQSPIEYQLTPLKTVCKDQKSALIRKITEDLVNSVLEQLSDLKRHKEKVNYLLSTDPAIRYTAIREQLLTFKAHLDVFYAKMASSVAYVLPLIKARQAEESALTDILVELQKSPFTKARSLAFLEQRTREIKTILKIVEDTLKNDNIQLSDIVSATDNECIFKKKLGTVFILNLLPDLGLANRFIRCEEGDKDWSRVEENSWINNNREVKDIGNKKRIFNDYVKSNLGLGEKNSDHCYMVKLDSLNMTMKYEMHIYLKGHQVTNKFDPPPRPDKAACGVAYADGFDLGTEAVTGYEDVTGIKVYSHGLVKGFQSEQVLENDSTVRVTGLLPDEPYEIKYRYVVREGHGYSEPAPDTTCRTLPTSAPTALMASENDASSLKLSWARPDIVAHHLRNQAITYAVTINEGSNFNVHIARTETVSSLSKSWSGLKAGTTYTVSVTPKIKGIDGKAAILTTVTAPAAPAAPVPGHIQDNRVQFAIKVGDVSVPAGVTKELLSIKYYKLKNGQPVSGSTVHYMQRLQDQGNTVIDIASFETGTHYGVQVKLLVEYGERLLGTEYSSEARVITTSTGSPIDNLRDDINQFEASSKQNLDTANAQKGQLTATLANAESKFNSEKSDGLKKITDLSGDISNNFVSVQKKSNALQKSKCLVDGYQFWSSSTIGGAVTVNSLADCLARCADTDGCSSSSFRLTPQNGITRGSCELYSLRMGRYLYSKTNYFSSNMYCQIMDAATIDTWKECVKDNTNYGGADIKSSVGISNIEECVAFCQTVDSCVSVTYNKSTKTCYAKNKRKGNGVSSNNIAVSVTMACMSANRGGVRRCAKNGVRFTGSVIQTTNQGSLDLCIQFCTYRDSCESVSYNASSKSCEAHNKRRGASRPNAGGWTSVNINCLGLQYF